MKAKATIVKKEDFEWKKRMHAAYERAEQILRPYEIIVDVDGDFWDGINLKPIRVNAIVCILRTEVQDIKMSSKEWRLVLATFGVVVDTFAQMEGKENFDGERYISERIHRKKSIGNTEHSPDSRGVVRGIAFGETAYAADEIARREVFGDKRRDGT